LHGVRPTKGSFYIPVLISLVRLMFPVPRTWDLGREMQGQFLQLAVERTTSSKPGNDPRMPRSPGWIDTA
jgi:hypothetical protein